MFLRRTIHFRSCAQDKTATATRIVDKIFYYRSHSLSFNIFIFWFGVILCCLQKESFIWGVCNFLFFSLPEL